jgi:hypothetical protein
MARQAFDPMAEYEIRPGALPFEAVAGNIPADVKAVDDGVIRAELGMAAADMDEQLDAILVQATAAAGSTGSGVHPCVWTVTDGTNTLQNAKVSFWLNGQLKGTGTTNGDGEVSMSLDPAVYDVAISCDGHVFAGTTHEVTAASGTWTKTFEMTTVNVTPPPSEDTSTVRIYTRVGGVLKPSLLVQLKQMEIKANSTGYGDSDDIREQRSNAAGYVEFTVLRNAPHGWRMGTSGTFNSFTPNAPTYTAMASAVGHEPR